jgi:hypothetical protein
MTVDEFYEQKVIEAKAAAASFKLQGMEVTWEDLMSDGKDIWYEYQALVAESKADDAFGDGDPSQWTY